MTRRLLSVLLLLASWMTPISLHAESHALVPKPQKVVCGEGDFRIAPAETTICYLDYRQAKELRNDPRGHGNRVVSLEKTYGYEPIPDYLAPELHGNIVGLQGNLWGEQLLSFPHMLYQTWPRACAVAEVGWSNHEGRDYEEFLARLKKTHLQRLRATGVTLRDPVACFCVLSAT